MAWTRDLLAGGEPAMKRIAMALSRISTVERHWDLSRCWIVLPTWSACRRAAESLRDWASLQSAELHEPVFLPVAELDARLSQERRAGSQARAFAWQRALREAPEADVLAIMGRRPDDADDAGWWALASIVVQFQEALLAEGVTAAELTERPGFELVESVDRYRAIARIESTCDAILREAATRESVAVEEFPDRCVLVHVLSLPAPLREVLRQMAETRDVASWVLAEEDAEAEFDETGEIHPSSNRPSERSIAREDLVVVDHPDDEARAALDAWSSAPNETVMALVDPAVELPLRQAIQRRGLGVAMDAVQRVERAAFVSVIDRLMTFAETRRADDLARLIREPDLHAALATDDVPAGCVARQLLSAFDAYAAESLPSVIEKLPESLEPKELWSRLESWVDRLPHDAVPMAYWQSSVESIIEEMGPARVESGSATGDRLPTDVLLEGIGSISKELAALGGPMSGGTFRRLVRERLTSSCDRWSTRASSVPIVAWEEIPLTSHPRVIVVGMNDGMLAMGVDGGPLLTGAVRSLACARCDGQMRAIHHRVFAELLAERHATFLVARSTGEGDPLLPHAWVLAGTVDEKARRLLDFFKRPVTPVETRTRSVGVWSLDVPRAKRNVAIDELPVTAFRDFLACPYRFYLRHVLKLRRVGEPPLELDPLQFGSLMHDVLREFAMSREATSTRPDEIAGSIETALVRLASRQFPRSAPSVTIQLEQIRVRLEAFASWQARWADQGWRICGTEVGPTRRQAALMVDSEPFYLSGRIDRIDYNADTNEWMLIDYKSSERAGTPAETHRDGDAWIDLQLPLYRHLVRHLTDLDPRPTDLSQVGLAYLAIPRDVTKTGELKAPWTEGELSEADEVARQVVRAIRQGDFGMPTPGAGDAFPDYDRVCQDGLFVRGGTDGD